MMLSKKNIGVLALAKCVRKEKEMNLEGMLPVAIGVLVAPLIIIFIAREMKRIKELKGEKSTQ